jgi:hypothetical protein
MFYRRYEILLPTRHNDGTPVEPEEFLLVNSELAARFGAVSFLPEIIHGVWLQQGQRFEDENVRLFVDVEDSLRGRAVLQELQRDAQTPVSTARHLDRVVRHSGHLIVAFRQERSRHGAKLR